MSWHRIAVDSIPPTPWRNGGGTTRELVVFPVREHWHWRMSVATIAQDGPFSVFEGVERWFAVLSGDGVRLSMGGNTHALRPDSPPLSFDGGVATQSELVGGPTEDFNLMVRQGRGHMERVHGSLALAVASGSAVALWSGEHAASATFEGATLELPPRTLAWRHLDMGGRVTLQATQGLWMEIAQ
ncbi:HutD/Ves family protein [Caenimonas aquaedulcis]|uniref:HutD family protein n=1 Tax=Caenimonas aquaedulcis TaxID=2793270 RepID=A0A931H2B2_9BURK|nr:HutD family protein [Caenimonas aquaedulcis]MBG9387261.1 HutD family protein [Caenimonas aquaedulcis]